MDDKRICKYPGCRTRLNRYNDGDYCHEHEDARKKLEEQEVERPLHNSGSASRQGYLTVMQFAESVGYSDRTVRNWLNKGRIKGHRFGSTGKWFIPESEVDRDFSSVKDGTGSAIQAESGPSAKSLNWIEAHKAEHGEWPSLPEPLGLLVKNYTPGQPVRKDMVIFNANIGDWNAIKGVPGLEKKWREFLEWLGRDPDEYEYKVRSLGPPKGGAIHLTWKRPRPR